MNGQNGYFSSSTKPFAAGWIGIALGLQALAANGQEPAPLHSDEAVNGSPQFDQHLRLNPEPEVKTNPPGATESLFSFRYLKLVAEDVKETFTAPAHWDALNWLTAGGIAGGLTALSFFDQDIRDAVQDNRSGTLDDVSRAIQPFGAEYSFGVLAGFYVGGELFKDDRAKATALDGLSASFISGLLIAEPLKFIAGRRRPNEGGSDHFQPFGGDQSFPSGHAMQAFTVAAVISEHYESLWVRSVSYGLAGMVGFARMEQNSHWASDVAASAVIGTFVGHVVVRFNQEQRNVRLEPIVGPEVQAIRFTYSF